jgi:hypothetical protein
MTYLFGIDTSEIANGTVNTQASALIGGTPKFWGRYFNGTADKKHQYQTSENAVLHQLGIPVMCFARQMWAVNNPDQTAAKAQAQLNMQGVVDAFGAQYLHGQNISPIIYLDLEPEDDNPNYVMDQAYYTAWASAIVAGYNARASTIRFRPAVYLNQGSSKQSWLNLNAACASGSVCAGVSMAQYAYSVHGDCASPPQPYTSLVWNDAQRTPQPDPIPPGHANAHIPLLTWQYYGDYPRSRDAQGHIVLGDIDPHLINPAHASVVLSGAVPPPAGLQCST